MFRILVVDDSATDVFMLREALKALRRPCLIDWVRDGSAALDFLYQRGAHAGAARPHLILMDVHMPRINGVEAIVMIKSDPQLRVIPAIMFSSSTLPDEVKNSYRAHANAYVQKPASLDNSRQLVHAIESFWMDVAVLSPKDERSAAELPLRIPAKPLAEAAAISGDTHIGRASATNPAEALSQAMRSSESVLMQRIAAPRVGACEEHRRLLDGFGTAVHELLQLHHQQFLAIIQGDVDISRFDLLIHMASEKKQLAKYDYIRHVESHGCVNANAFNETRA